MATDKRTPGSAQPENSVLMSEYSGPVLSGSGDAVTTGAALETATRHAELKESMGLLSQGAGDLSATVEGLAKLEAIRQSPLEGAVAPADVQDFRNALNDAVQDLPPAGSATLMSYVAMARTDELLSQGEPQAALNELDAVIVALDRYEGDGIVEVKQGLETARDGLLAQDNVKLEQGMGVTFAAWEGLAGQASSSSLEHLDTKLESAQFVRVQDSFYEGPNYAAVLEQSPTSAGPRTLDDLLGIAPQAAVGQANTLQGAEAASVAVASAKLDQALGNDSSAPVVEAVQEASWIERQAQVLTDAAKDVVAKVEDLVSGPEPTQKPTESDMAAVGVASATLDQALEPQGPSATDASTLDELLSTSPQTAASEQAPKLEGAEAASVAAANAKLDDALGNDKSGAAAEEPSWLAQKLSSMGTSVKETIQEAVMDVNYFFGNEPKVEGPAAPMSDDEIKQANDVLDKAHAMLGGQYGPGEGARPDAFQSFMAVVKENLGVGDMESRAIANNDVIPPTPVVGESTAWASANSTLDSALAATAPTQEAQSLASANSTLDTALAATAPSREAPDLDSLLGLAREKLGDIPDVSSPSAQVAQVASNPASAMSSELDKLLDTDLRGHEPAAGHAQERDPEGQGKQAQMEREMDMGDM